MEIYYQRVVWVYSKKQIAVLALCAGKMDPMVGCQKLKYLLEAFASRRLFTSHVCISAV